MEQIYNLLDRKIPELRQSLDENHYNLDRVAAYCEANYLQAQDKRHALEETKNYTTQSLASVAYQISELASNFVTLLDVQFNQVAEMESGVNYLAQTVAIHKEKVARREIGVLTTTKTTPRLQGVKNPGIIFPAEQERPGKYIRKPIDYTILDDIGHGVKLQQREPARRHPSDVSRQSVQSAGPPAAISPSSQQANSDYRTSRGMTGSLSRQSSNQSNYSQMPAAASNRTSTSSHYRTTQGMAGVPKQVSSPYRTPMTAPPPTVPMQQPQEGTRVSYRMNDPPPAPPPATTGPDMGAPLGMATPIARNPSVRSTYSHAGQMGGSNSQYIHDSFPDLPPPPDMMGAELESAASPPLPPPPMMAMMDEPPDFGAAPPGPPRNMQYGMHNQGRFSRGQSLQGYEPEPEPQDSWVPRDYIEKVVAIYDYSKDKDDELSFSEGSVIYVVKKNDDGWWEGVMDGQTGLFPGNYVEPCM